MKIVYCVESLGFGGGVERVTTIKANYLASLGHQVTIITGDLGTRTPKYGISPSVTIIDWGLKYFEDFSYSIGIRFLRTIRKIYRHRKLMKQFLLEYQPDVIISTHRYETVFLPYLHDRSVKILECHSSKSMYQRHSPTSHWSLRRLLYKGYELRDDILSRRFDKIAVLTQEDYDLRGRKKNMCIIPNPVPFEPDKPSSLTNKVILAIGRFEPEKNFASLIRIWSKICQKYSDWKLVLVGQGYLYEDLYTLSQKLHLDQAIEFKEETSNVISLYKGASVYAMTSKYEGLPMTLIEAQSMGLPIISYSCPCGPQDIITHSENGFLVEPENESQFTSYLEQLLKDEELRISMGKKAIESSSRYSIDHVMNMWIEMFNQSQQ